MHEKERLIQSARDPRRLTPTSTTAQGELVGVAGAPTLGLTDGVADPVRLVVPVCVASCEGVCVPVAEGVDVAEGERAALAEPERLGVRDALRVPLWLLVAVSDDD